MTVELHFFIQSVIDTCISIAMGYSRPYIPLLSWEKNIYNLDFVVPLSQRSMACKIHVLTKSKRINVFSETVVFF